MTNRQQPKRSLRLWPGVTIVTLQLAAWFLLPLVRPDAAIFAVMGGIAGAAAVGVWWVFFSGAPGTERVAVVAMTVAALAATRPFLHESVGTGAMGFLFYILVAPGLSAAIVIWAVATRNLSTAVRYAWMVVAIVVASGAWSLVRTGGFTGDFDNDLAWRWTPTPEERLLAEAGDDLPPAPPPSAPAPSAAEPVADAETAMPVTDSASAQPEAAVAPLSEPPAPLAHAVVAPSEPDPVWPGFRGSDRNGVVRGVTIATDWAASPPVEIWRRPIGPGWSSFAINGDRLYTQEQRGEDEVVAAYDLATGAPVWRHADRARFWESNGGAGPRGTPTLHQGRVYTFGATGILNVLDGASGARVWSRDVAADTGVAVPTWGFSSSPLVVDDLVIVAAAGKLAAYEITTGAPRWQGPDDGDGYSSPQLATIDGVPQILLISATGATSVTPSDGSPLWTHEWRTGTRIVQPAITPEGDILLGAEGSLGMQRFAVTRGPAAWTTEERWTTNRLKPYFSDFVVHEGYAYGFDGSILASIDLADGSRAWKGGRYGQGQLVLLPDQDLLLVLAEDGDLAVVRAAPEGHQELARVPAIEGKTWNHPVLVDDLLLVRNGQEMAAFRLPRLAR